MSEARENLTDWQTWHDGDRYLLWIRKAIWNIVAFGETLKPQNLPLCDG